MQKVACTRVCYSNDLNRTTALSLKDHVLPQDDHGLTRILFFGQSTAGPWFTF